MLRLVDIILPCRVWSRQDYAVMTVEGNAHTGCAIARVSYLLHPHCKPNVVQHNQQYQSETHVNRNFNLLVQNDCEMGFNQRKVLSAKEHTNPS